MALTADPAAIRSFVLDALRLAGASFSTVDGDLVLASCEITRPGGIFVGPRVVREDIQLVFTPEGAARHPSAELVCPGSYRLQWFIEGLRARGFLTRQYYAEDLNTRRIEREILNLLPPQAPPFSFKGQRRSFVPYLLAVIRLSMVAHDKREELLALALNLTDGSYRPGLPERLRRAAMMPELGFQRVERRRLTWRAAWRSLMDQALARAASYGDDWYRPAINRLTAEGGQLRQYYLESLAKEEDEDAVRAEYARRLAELTEKCTPVVRVSLQSAALLYLPHLVYQVAGRDGRPLPPLRYEPASGLVQWEAIPPLRTEA